VNYFREFIGNYLAATSHLGLVDHGAHRVLTLHYMSREGPFPVDLDFMRLCRATTPAERRAVQAVLDEFFPVVEGVRRNAECDRELAIALPRIEAARRNGSFGGRPQKNPVGNPTGIPAGFQSEPTGVPSAKPIQPPAARSIQKQRQRLLVSDWQASSADLAAAYEARSDLDINATLDKFMTYYGEREITKTAPMWSRAWLEWVAKERDGTCEVKGEHMHRNAVVAEHDPGRAAALRSAQDTARLLQQRATAESAVAMPDELRTRHGRV